MALAEQGAEVNILEINAKPAKETAAEIKATGGYAQAHTCDISNQKDVIKTVEAKGIILENRSRRLELLRQEEEQRRMQEETLRRRARPAKKPKKKDVAWYLRPLQMVTDTMASLVDTIFAFFGWTNASS